MSSRFIFDRLSDVSDNSSNNGPGSSLTESVCSLSVRPRIEANCLSVFCASTISIPSSADLFIETGWVGVEDRNFDLGNNAKLEMDSQGSWKTQIGFRHRL